MSPSIKDTATVRKRLNIGCGNKKIDGYVNVDQNSSLDPDLIADIRFGLPFESDSVQEILFFHTIEHIEEKYHEDIFREFHRVLYPCGNLILSYPEFIVCAQNYIDNVKGMRDFWKATLYGLQRYAGDYHVSLMDSDYVVTKLQECGFKDIFYAPESAEPYNTVMIAHKGDKVKTYEELWTPDTAIIQ